MNSECNADLGSPCTGGVDGDPCDSCKANEAYWRNEWERIGKYEMRNQMSEEDINDCYSDPAERSKRDALLAR